jgi:dTMP kinase
MSLEESELLGGLQNLEISKDLLKDGDPERMGQLLAVAVEQSKSPSHDIHHIALTLQYANILYQWSSDQGQIPHWEHIFAAACLHDLGRNDPSLHGQASVEASLAIARLILLQIAYDDLVGVEAICQIIKEHDQPRDVSTSLEARILKEADFLAGMGAWGILRVLVWGGECRRSVPEMIEALEVRMSQRVESLQFPPSKEIAWREWPIARLFLASLKEQLKGQEVEIFPGRYLILEGISGTGKETQAAMLADYLRQEHRLQVEVVCEPSDLARKTLDLWKESGEVTPEQRAHLMIADRIGIIDRVNDLRRRGITVISIRSFLSNLVYQGDTDWAVAKIMFDNQFVPRPEAIVLLKVDPELALARVDRRLATVGGKRGDFEEIEKLRRISERYKEVLRQLCPRVKIVEIDGSGEPQEVFQRILDSLLITDLTS